MSRSFQAEIGKKVQVGNFSVTIEEPLAEGGFAVVFLVKASNGQRFALKRMYVNDYARLGNCKREIQILNSLSAHKNIITCVESSVNQLSNGVWEVCILLHFCASNVILMMNERIGVGFSEGEIMKIFCDVCEAVSRLHHCQTPIIHRDLKAENILFDSSSRNYVLCDFGSATARVLDPSTQGVREIEEEINKYTTLSYRAPEMVDLYSNHPITIKSDIWALGVLLYRLCFFSLPFAESALAIQNGHFSVPDEVKVSRQTLQLIRYCLEIDPSKRPDIYQVSHVAFNICRQACPVVNIQKSPVPDVTQIPFPPTESEAKKARPSTVRTIDRSDRVETTTVTPRQRPKAGGSGAGGGSSVAGATVQRPLFGTPGLQPAQSRGADAGSSQAQLAAQQQQQQAALAQQQQQAQALAQQQQQQAALAQQQQQQAALAQQQAAVAQQQQAQAQSQQQQAPSTNVLSQTEANAKAHAQLMARAQQLAHAHAQYQALSLQASTLEEQQSAKQHVEQAAAAHAQVIAQANQLVQAEAQAQLKAQQHVQQQQQQQQAQALALAQLKAKQQAQQQQQQQQQSAQLQNSASIDFGSTHGAGSQNVSSVSPFAAAFDPPPSGPAPMDDPAAAGFADAFEDNFTSVTTSATSATPLFPTSDSFSWDPQPSATGSRHGSSGGGNFGDEFKVPAVPPMIEVKHCDNAPHPRAAAAVAGSHRRNASDTAAIALGRGGCETQESSTTSAFNTYGASGGNEEGKECGGARMKLHGPHRLTAGQRGSYGSVGSLNSNNSHHKSLSPTGNEFMGHSQKAVSTEMIGNENWNPFVEDDTYSDDVMFEFEKLRHGSTSSLQNVKSREDLIMSEEGGPSAGAVGPGGTIDPFGAAPFNPNHKAQEKYSRLRPVSSYDNITGATAGSSGNGGAGMAGVAGGRPNPTTIFGLSIPFSRKERGGSRYRKVPLHDEDDSVSGASSESDAGGNVSVLKDAGKERVDTTSGRMLGQADKGLSDLSSSSSSSSSDEEEDTLNETVRSTDFKYQQMVAERKGSDSDEGKRSRQISESLDAGESFFREPAKDIPMNNTNDSMSPCADLMGSMPVPEVKAVTLSGLELSASPSETLVGSVPDEKWTTDPFGGVPFSTKKRGVGKHQLGKGGANDSISGGSTAATPTSQGATPTEGISSVASTPISVGEGRLTPPISSTPGLPTSEDSPQLGSSPSTTSAIRADIVPVPILPTNPFLSDLVDEAGVASQGDTQVESDESEDPLFSELAANRSASAAAKGSKETVNPLINPSMIRSAPVDSVFMPRSVSDFGFLTLPRKGQGHLSSSSSGFRGTPRGVITSGSSALPSRPILICNMQRSLDSPLGPGDGGIQTDSNALRRSKTDYDVSGHTVPISSVPSLTSNESSSQQAQMSASARNIYTRPVISTPTSSGGAPDSSKQRVTDTRMFNFPSGMSKSSGSGQLSSPLGVSNANSQDPQSDEEDDEGEDGSLLSCTGGDSRGRFFKGGTASLKRSKNKSSKASKSSPKTVNSAVSRSTSHASAIHRSPGTSSIMPGKRGQLRHHQGGGTGLDFGAGDNSCEDEEEAGIGGNYAAVSNAAFCEPDTISSASSTEERKGVGSGLGTLNMHDGIDGASSFVKTHSRNLSYDMATGRTAVRMEIPSPSLSSASVASPASTARAPSTKGKKKGKGGFTAFLT